MLQLYFNKILQFLNYDIYFPISFFILSFSTLVYFLKTNENKKLKIYLFILCLIFLLFILWSFFLSYYQYFIWKNNAISKFLLPPYQNLDYFLNYVYFRFWRDFIYRLLGSFFLFLFLVFINFIFKRDVFYKEEKILIIILSFVYFFPYNLFFIFSGFFVLLLIIMINLIFEKSTQRYFSFKNYWLFWGWLIFLSQPLFLMNYEFLKFKP